MTVHKGRTEHTRNFTKKNSTCRVESLAERIQLTGLDRGPVPVSLSLIQAIDRYRYRSLSSLRELLGRDVDNCLGLAGECLT